MIPRTPLPEVTFPLVPDALEAEHAAIHWLVTHRHSLTYALENWRRVELIYATFDDPDRFWVGTRMFRVLNPADFGVIPFMPTQPATYEAEALSLTPPDVDPGPGNDFMPLDEAPEPAVKPASRAMRCCTWLGCCGLCALTWVAAFGLGAALLRQGGWL